MDQDQEIRFEYPGVFRLYKSGRIDRLVGTDFVPASVDPAATGVSTKDVTIGSATGVTARLYLPNIARDDRRVPILVYFHGGAFCVESPFSATYDAYVRSVASRTNLLAVSVSYRMAPEHPLPSAYDDCWSAMLWVASRHAEDSWIEEYGDVARIFVAGDSAGGNIAHRMAVRAGGDGGVGIERMALVHPYFWGKEAVGREITGAAERGWMEELWKSVTGPEADEAWIDAKAEEAVRCRGLRRVMVCVAERDWLCERGRAYCDAARRSGWGGEVELAVAEGEEHTFHLSRPGCDKALELMDRLVAFFCWDSNPSCHTVLSIG